MLIKKVRLHIFEDWNVFLNFALRGEGSLFKHTYLFQKVIGKIFDHEDVRKHYNWALIVGNYFIVKHNYENLITTETITRKFVSYYYLIKYLQNENYLVY